MPRLGFNGERPEPTTGHYLLGNGSRVYNPVLLRFNQPDSWSPFAAGGLNAYQYCLGDPINLRDPTGHAAQGNGESDSASPWLWISMAIGMAVLGAGIGVLALKKKYMNPAFELPRPTSPPPPVPTRPSVIVESTSGSSVIRYAPPAIQPTTPSRPPATISHVSRSVRFPGVDENRAALDRAVQKLDHASFIQYAGKSGSGVDAQRALNAHLPDRELIGNSDGAVDFRMQDFKTYRANVLAKYGQDKANRRLFPFLDRVQPEIRRIRTTKKRRPNMRNVHRP